MARLAVGLLVIASMIAPGARAADTPPPLERARALLADGKTDQAIELLRIGVAAQPDEASLHNMLGAVLNREGRYPEALVHADRAAALAPANPRYRYNRGIVLAEHGRFAEALADFDLAIAAMPREAPMYLERGAALLALDRADRARSDWAAARRLDPTLVWIDWYEGLHDLIDGGHSKAIAALQRVAAAQPEFAPAQSWLIAGHAMTGDRYLPTKVSDPWVAAILEFHAGKLTGERLLEIARADQITGDRRREGEAWLHIALRLRASGQVGANAALEKAAAIDAPRHVWKQLAERMLQRS